MNKLLSLAALSAISFTALADDSASDLVFKFLDGSEQSIAAKNLVMKINDGSIEADNGAMNLNIPLASLQQFYFGSTTGIVDLIQDTANWSLYNLEGKEVGTYSSLKECQSLLPAGVYVAKSATTILKIAIR